MNAFERIAWTLAFLPLVAGCTQSLWVHERLVEGSGQDQKIRNRDLKGIPFYTKVARFEHVTTYEKRWKKVTLRPKTQLEYVENGTPKIRETDGAALMRSTTSTSGELAALKGLLVDDVDAKAIRRAFQALPPVDVDTIAPTLVGNRVERIVEVDYRRELYLNAPLPWFGTSNTTTKLGPDGTLTEASSSAETRLAEGISTLLPVKEVLSAAAAKAGGMPVALTFGPELTSGVPQASLRDSETREIFFLEIEETGLVYEIRVPTAASPIAADGMIAPTPFAEREAYPLTVAPIAAARPDAAKKEAANKISLSGDIVLPKGMAPAAPAPAK